MNYTEIYRKIYAAAKNDSVPHELAHSISIKITDAVTTLRTYVRENHPEILSAVEEVFTDFWAKSAKQPEGNSWVDFYESSTWRPGGFDLDDKN